MTKLVIFDLDGTIADSWPCMLYCYRETFKAFGKDGMSDEEFYTGFVGDLNDNLGRMLNIDGEDLDRAVHIFRDAYSDKGHALSKPFEGALETIRELNSRGYVLGVATMVLEKYAIDTFIELQVTDCFSVIRGSDEKGLRTKTDMIRMCMESTGMQPKDTVMIGDGFNDQSAAKKAGVGFIAAAYGYGITKENCLEYGIDYVASPKDILAKVCSHWND